MNVFIQDKLPSSPQNLSSSPGLDRFSASFSAGQALFVGCEGVLDETSNFSHLEASLSGKKEIIFHLAKLSRATSPGIKQWILLLNALKEKGVSLFISEASPFVVELMNSIVSFFEGIQILSLYIPYYCPTCREELYSLLSAEEGKTIKDASSVPTLMCPKCSQTLTFDDDPSLYFRFLTRRAT